MRLIFLPLCLGAAACSPTTQSAVAPPASSAENLPSGATLLPSGYASIGIVPPSAFPSDPPPMPTQLDVFARRTVYGSEEDRGAVWENANGTEEFQSTFYQLREQVARGEPDNFITVQLIRENGVQGEFVFQRKGDATLRKYTNDPRFVARTVDFDAAQLRELRELWLGRMEEASIMSLSSDEIDGQIEMDVGLEEKPFRELATRRDWDIEDPLLAFRFAPSQPAALASENLSGLVRVFAREDKQVSIRLTALGTGRIILDDGCFRLANQDGTPGDKLVMFARQSQLDTDEEGYLVVRTQDELYRVGEPGAWNAPNAVDEKNPDVRALRKACGEDEIVNVAGPQSERLFALPYPLWVLDYAHTKQITYDAAWDEVIGCIEREEQRGRQGLGARDACIDQYNGWDYTGEELPPPPGQ